jgi:hypothetical protein
MRKLARPQLLVEVLEERCVLSGALDVTGLTALRADPLFADIDGADPDPSHTIGIAILDTGIFSAHPDLAPNFIRSYDAVTRQESAVAVDPNGHGSHVAGTAAARNPDVGVAIRANLISVRVFPTDNEQPRHDTLADGLQWVIGNVQRFNIRVVNMSLGYRNNINDPAAIPTHEIYATLIDELERLGVTVVTASGNSYAHFIEAGASSPAVYSTLSVANTWEDSGSGDSFPYIRGMSGDSFYGIDYNAQADRLTSTSQRSTLPNQVAAPGESIFSTWNGALGSSGQPKLYNTIGGTSMATPFVTGLVALMQDAAFTYSGSYLPPADVVRILRDTADDIIDSPTSSNARLPVSATSLSQAIDLPETGATFKRVNAYRALQQVRAERLGGGAGDTADINATLDTASLVPSLDGNRVYFLSGNIGADGSSTVGPGDVDVYRVVLQSPGKLRWDFSRTGGIIDFDGRLRLFNAAGVELSFSDVAAGARPTLVSEQLTAGTYYFGITSLNNTAYNPVDGSNGINGLDEGRYSLEVSLDNPDPNGIITGAVPFTGFPAFFSSLIDSDPPPLDSTTRIEVGSQDVDMFEIIAPDDGELIIDVDSFGLSGNPAPFNTLVRVFDASGQEIARNDNDPAGGTLDSFLRLPMTRGQRVFGAVSDAANSDYDPIDPYTRTSAGTGGQLNLTLTFDNRDVNGSAFDATIRNSLNDTIQASVGRDSGVLVGKDGALDVDWYRYLPTSNLLLDLEVTTADGDLRPLLSVWTVDSTGQNLIKLADSADSTPRHILRVSANRAYYVAVTGEGNGNFAWFAPATGSGGDTGDYQLSVQSRPWADQFTLADNSVLDHVPGAVELDSAVRDEVGRDGFFVTGNTDVDVYRFVAPRDGLMQADALAVTEQIGDTSDPFLRIFTASGQEIAFNDDADGRTRSASVQFAVSAGAMYFIGVNGASAGARSYSVLTGSGAVAGTLGAYLLLVSDQTPEVQEPGPPAPPPLRGDVTSLVSVSRDRQRQRGRRVRLTLTLRNTSGVRLEGPLFLVIRGLEGKARRGGSIANAARPRPVQIIRFVSVEGLEANGVLTVEVLFPVARGRSLRVGRFRVLTG